MFKVRTLIYFLSVTLVTLASAVLSQYTGVKQHIMTISELFCIATATLATSAPVSLAKHKGSQIVSVWYDN